MLDLFNWNFRPTTLFAVALLIAVAVVVLLTLLTFAWGFELETSSTWQVVAYNLMLTLLFSLTLVMGSYRPVCFGEWFPRMMLAVALVVPAVVFAVSWVTGGAYLGFRDPRIVPAVAISVSTYTVIWALAAFPWSFYLLVRDLSRVWRHGRSGKPDLIGFHE